MASRFEAAATLLGEWWAWEAQLESVKVDIAP
jgi:hypothetical protein